MSAQDVNVLVEMGFTNERAAQALAMTGNQGVEAAMEWLLAHTGELEQPSQTLPEPPSAAPTLVLPKISEPQSTPVSGEEKEENSQENQTAKSLKCDECGKLFKNQLEVEFHASKSGHSSFSESIEEKKPLTEEERKEQLRLVEEKLKQKRKEREEREKLEALEREKNRIRSGKEMSAAKKKLEDEEIKKIVEQRKREKEEEKNARERVKAQIEADKAARRAKFSGDVAVKVTAEPQKVNVTPKDYTQTRIQIRLTNGQTLTQTFGIKEQLSAVRLYVEMNRTDDKGPFLLMTNFPKKVFKEDDFEKPLDHLGLVPSAVIILSKGTQ